MKECFLKVGGLFLPTKSPVQVTFTRFLARTFRKVWSTSALNNFYRRCYIIGIITHLQNNFLNWRSRAPPNTAPEGWMVQNIEDSSLQNISYQINWWRSQISILYIKFPGFCHWKAIYENVYKGLHKSTQNHWNSF